MQTNQQCSNTGLEFWGGIECTINRINDSYFDQLSYANHYTRENDLDQIAELGIKTLRYPILWELHEPEINKQIDWSWTEKQLNILNKNDIKIIAGLLHHGSGPSYTNLLDNNFADNFSNYAEKVATRFPWIEYYTPINEPLTTARFSGLYGFWYPHVQNDVSFVKMFLSQMKGIVLAMQKIRSINPNAKLVQTEDLGKTYCSASLSYQAKFENERRWLTYDLLCGKIGEEHSMWKYFLRLGISEDLLNFFLENTCPPDIMGFNYYITSERFLDENLDIYPSNTHGSNELQMYADVEAIRVPHTNKSGLEVLLKEAWERYKLPIAITEVQLNCGREDQVRWLKQTWDTCLNLKRNGIDIKAVTAWALLGAFGWNRLLTSEKMDYEPGVFDIRSGILRPTALTSVISSLISSQAYTHPLLEQNGWWHTDARFIYEKDFDENKILQPETSSQPLLIIGKTGTLGKAFGKICGYRSINFRLLSREDVDITNESEIENVINKYNPWAVINAAGFVRVDDAETEIEKCFNENSKGPHLLAKSCKKYGIRFMTFSSDMVFDGKKETPYFENDEIRPLNIYGKSKAEAEASVLNVNPDSLIIRTSSFFGPWDHYNFVSHVIKTLSENNSFIAADDVIISPTYVPDLVNASLDLLIDNEKGIWHLTNKGEISWATFAVKIAEKAGLDSGLIIAKPVHLLNWKASRPKYTALKTSKGMLLPSFNNALKRFFIDRRVYSQSETIHISA